MMNKKNLWFLTLFSLVLVLSIYYITMPSDLLKATGYDNVSDSKEEVDATVEVSESNAISALKVEDDAKVQDTISELKEKIIDTDATVLEKNDAYEQIKILNTNSGLEDSIEAKISEEYNCEAFTKISDSSVKVVVDKCENSKGLANNIMRLVQEQFDSKMYISVKFES